MSRTIYPSVRAKYTLGASRWDTKNLPSLVLGIEKLVLCGRPLQCVGSQFCKCHQKKLSSLLDALRGFFPSVCLSTGIISIQSQYKTLGWSHWRPCCGTFHGSLSKYIWWCFGLGTLWLLQDCSFIPHYATSVPSLSFLSWCTVPINSHLTSLSAPSLCANSGCDFMIG